jgi:hypothetical protein
MEADTDPMSASCSPSHGMAVPAPIQYTTVTTGMPTDVTPTIPTNRYPSHFQFPS